jgi:gamma-glutamylaminecyclotransferase
MFLGRKQLMHKVFVYGTLKKGWGNNRLMVEGNAKFLGPAVTMDSFKLYGMGVPFMRPGGDDVVAGEVYEVDDATLARLDRLEGHSITGDGMYNRELIPVRYGTPDNYKTETVFAYIGNKRVANRGTEYTEKNAFGQLNWGSRYANAD